MDKEIINLNPTALWKNFADLNAVPRASKKEQRVIEFVQKFGEKLGLETLTDKIGNVVIKKPATPGMEHKKTVILQSHLDMVHQKNKETVFNFDTMGIKMFVEEDWVKAKGTTLGADNGIGVATIMAILESTNMAHPPIEALFTIDEETGMTGAIELQTNMLEGEILLNLDTECDDEIDIGCAGGMDVTASNTYEQEEIIGDVVAYHIIVKGLLGGHSGMDIHKGLGNANKIINRLLFHGTEKYKLRIAKINGGGLRNAIPRESNAIVAIHKADKNAFLSDFDTLAHSIKEELKHKEPNLSIIIETTKLPRFVMVMETQKKLLKSLYTAHNGVYRNSDTMEDLVETSNNIAQVSVSDGKIEIGCLTRSSVESAKLDLANSLKSAFELMGCEVIFSGSYPGWNPNLESEILEVLKSIYVAKFKESPKIVACHAGLECGILKKHYPDIDMISYGPTILGAHSPDERVSIRSVQKFWEYTKAILKEIPDKK